MVRRRLHLHIVMVRRILEPSCLGSCGRNVLRLGRIHRTHQSQCQLHHKVFLNHKGCHYQCDIRHRCHNFRGCILDDIRNIQQLNCILTISDDVTFLQMSDVSTNLGDLSYWFVAESNTSLNVVYL